MTIINVIIDRFFNAPLREWIKIKGDQTLRLNYPLNKNSIVFDIGGFKGNWTKDIYSRYGCNIYIFEIVSLFVKDMQDKFKGNKNI